MKKQIVRRSYDEKTALNHLHPVLQRVYSARGISTAEELEKGFDKLEPFNLLKNIDEAVACLFSALENKHHIMIIGDFDVDGATSTALAVKCLQMMGASKVSYLVPNRFEYGYGLTPEIVSVAAQSKPDLLITVDNGISSYEGVNKAHQEGMKVIITDHHLPGVTLPSADAIVNPNLPDDAFPSKNLAGVGVVFYVLMALRAKLRQVNWFCQQNIPEVHMASFLDLVALGTVADVVPLDRNNRILVHHGLMRINAGKLRPGIRAILKAAGRRVEQTSAIDLGFFVAPRLNAAGRLDDMRLGIECLLTEDDALAQQHAQELDYLNRERQQIEATMRDQAIENIKKIQLKDDLPIGVCLFDETWHQGIIGIVASRIKDLVHRPVFAFALANAKELKGSGRSISGLHLKDILERIAIKHPGLVIKFGGHAMAAGLTISPQNLEAFADAFNEEVTQNLSPEALASIVHSDGALCQATMNLETAEILKQAGPWGQGFPEPLFDGEFKVVSHRVLKEKHLKLVLRSLENFFTVDAVAFNVDMENLNITQDAKVQIAYRLDVNEYRGAKSVQLLIEYFNVLS